MIPPVASESAESLISARRLEELTLNTAPAIHQHFYDGWVLRASGTDTRRANSATALAASHNTNDANIAAIEHWYGCHGQAACFRLSAALSPQGFDAALAQRGYRIDAPTDVMLAPLTSAPTLPRPPTGMQVAERNAAEGLDDIYALRGTAGQRVTLEKIRHALWKGPEKIISVRSVDGLLASGMARVDGDMVGVFNVRTAEGARRQGLATLLLAHLLAWGRACGAQRAFLQVEQSNVAAHRLYRRAGFSVALHYWHRLAP